MPWLSARSSVCRCHSSIDSPQASALRCASGAMSKLSVCAGSIDCDCAEAWATRRKTKMIDLFMSGTINRRR